MKILILAIALTIISVNAMAGVTMTVYFHSGEEVTRQFVDEEEFLMTFQAREHCAPGWSHFEVKIENIQGLDTDELEFKD